MIQIQKDSNDKKGARTSTHIKLIGKYVILMPNTNIVTISQKIENKEKKQQKRKQAKRKSEKEFFTQRTIFVLKRGQNTKETMKRGRGYYKQST